MSLPVLIGCERSGVVRRAMREAGLDAYSCDLTPADDGSPHHIQGDVREAIKSRRWAMGIFHPPCTRLSNSGVRWLAERNLWDAMHEACAFFAELYNSDIPCIAVENPVMHGYARNALLALGVPTFTQSIQPWQFGDNFKKRTCLWLRGLPALTPTSTLDGSTAKQAVWLESPGPERARKRSETYPGIAAAMVKQWGDFLVEKQTQQQSA